MDTNVKREMLSMEDLFSMSGGLAVLTPEEFSDGVKSTTATNAANCALFCGLSNNCFPCMKK